MLIDAWIFEFEIEQIEIYTVVITKWFMTIYQYRI